LDFGFWIADSKMADSITTDVVNGKASFFGGATLVQRKMRPRIARISRMKGRGQMQLRGYVEEFGGS
jgi:hypothetical protein